MEDPARKKLSDGAMERFSDLLKDDASVELPVLGRYRTIRFIAEGAVGRVYEAEDQQLGRRVAIKVLHASTSDVFVRRFHREAALAASLKHPNIVTIHEVSMVRREDGSPVHFIVMDYYERTLQEEMAGGGIDARRKAELVKSIAEAVDHAHQTGVIHRDLKPANILLDREGRPIVTDFGLARDESQVTQLTKTGSPVGTPSYMSPEQAAGKSKEIGPRSDVYSLGVILYELLTERLPFSGPSVAGVYAAILTQEPRRPRSVLPTIERDIESICLKAMERDPGRRYSTAGGLAADLKRFLAGEPVSAQSGTMAYRVARQVRRRPVVILGVAALALTLAAAIYLAQKGRSQSQQLEQAALSDQISGAYFDLHLGSLGPMQQLEDFFHQGKDADIEKALAEIQRNVETVSARYPAARLPKAWFGLAQFFAKKKEAIATLEAAVAEAGEDPFPLVFLARARMTMYVRKAYEEALLGSDKRGGNIGYFTETAAMKAERAKAVQSLGRARGLGLWKRLQRGTEYLTYAEAISDFGEGRFAESIVVLARLKDDAVLKTEAACLGGVALCLVRRFADGAEAWERAGEREWENLLLLAALARIDAGAALETKSENPVAQYEQAIADCRRIMGEEGWSSPSLVQGIAFDRLGRARKEQGISPVDDWKKALAAYTAALAIDPKLDEALKCRGYTHLEMSRESGIDFDVEHGLAMDDFNASLRILPDYEEALFGRAEAWSDLAAEQKRRHEDPRAALKSSLDDYTAGLRKRPDHYRALFDRARTWDELAEIEPDPIPAYQHSIADTSEAIRIKPDYDIAWSNRGDSRWLLGEAMAAKNLDPMATFRDALADFDEALRLNPTLAPTYMLRGVVYQSIAEWEGAHGGNPAASLGRAIEEFSESLRRKPGFDRALRGRALAYGVLGHDEVKRQVDPTPSYEKSLLDFDALLKTQDDDWESHVHAAELLQWLKRPKESVPHLEAALRVNPSNDYAKQLLAGVKGR